jgi:hypothetical protein
MHLESKMFPCSPSSAAMPDAGSDHRIQNFWSTVL